MQTFIINTKIYYNNHFIIASWAYLQQSPTCTRVNNLVYICKDITPWPSGAYHVCSWERFQSTNLTRSETYVFCNSFASPRITHFSNESALIVYVWSSGGTLIPRSEICYQYCHIQYSFIVLTLPELHQVFKKLLDSNTLGHCQNNDILCLRL